MTTLDQRLAAATDDLDCELEGLRPPPFRPNRSGSPLVLVVVLLIGVGVAGYATRTRTDNSGAVSVATQPETEQPGTDELAVVPEPADPGVDEYEEEATPLSRWRTLVDPAAGEFYMPIPMANAWSPDEAKVIVYRKDEDGSAHLVFDTFHADADPIILPFTPPDIEQIYWHPLVVDQLVYASGSELMVFDLNTMDSVVAERFDGCDSVDSGVLPVMPAGDGTVSLLCRFGSGVTQLSYNLATGQEQRAATQSDTAAVPSPSGDVLVRWNDDGSASVLDRSLNATGVELDLGNNHFGFVHDDQGREWIATTLFEGPAVGSVVLLALDGESPPIVLVGPDRGDPYPPRGTLISTAGDKVTISIAGIDDGLAGRITMLDLGVSFTDPPRRSIPHESADLHGYWSTPFISVSPSGVLVYSTDQGGDAVTTFVGNFITEVASAD